MSTQDTGTQVAEASTAPTAAPSSRGRDIVLSTLQEAVKGIASLAQDNKKAKSITKELDELESSFLPTAPPVPSEDKCKSPDPTIAPFCATLNLALATAQNAFTNAEAAAANELSSSAGAWELAIVQYHASLQTARAALQTAVNTAVETFKQKQNPDSQSRNLFLFYTMESEVDAALVSYKASAATAAAALAGAAGNLLESFTTYATTTASLEAVRLGAVSTAQETFWQSVEGARDQV